VDRAERLLTLVAELRKAAAASAPASIPVRLLAADLRVSERTIRRDLAELAEHGLPVRTVVGGVTLAATGKPAPVTPTDELRSLARPVMETAARAVLEHRVVRIAYTNESGERSVRDVEPHGLVIAPYGEYLVGWCRMREAPRTFRLDRIAAARLESGRAGRRDLDELLGALRVPAPRAPVPTSTGAPVAVPPVQARAWTLERIRLVRERSTEAVTSALSAQEGIARLRVVLGHLAEWTRGQLADLRAATGADRTLDGRRPALPAVFDGPLPYPVREKMIQDAMAVRAFGELARDLDEVLVAAAHWVADCADVLWRRAFPDPFTGAGVPARERPLADLLAGWTGPLSHIEWHLDRLDAKALDPFGSEPEGLDGPADDEAEGLLVTRCPLRA
jgi:predicted DNA-binding transcriptional regulator YafY